MNANLTYKHIPKDFLSNLNMSEKVTQVNIKKCCLIYLKSYCKVIF